jgi:putative methyltransferase (TIGR04325 family)
MTKPRGDGRLAKRIARAVLPPVIAGTYRELRRRSRKVAPPDWEYLPGGWPEPSTGSPGWNADSVVATQLERWPDFVRSVAAPAPFGLSNESASGPPNYGAHNTIMTFGYVLARAAQGKKRLSVLDWGGGIGHYCINARALLPELQLDYYCRDLPNLVAGGRTVLPEATFYVDEDEALAKRYDLVVASSSLHYSRDWRSLLARLAAATTDYLYVTRQPFVKEADSFVVVQRPHRFGYETEYPGWFLNRGEFLTAASDSGLTLLREFLIWEIPDVPNAPEAADYRGFLFAPTGR